MIGIDAAPAIGIRAVADSVIDATFLYPTEGNRLIRTALNILHGEPYDTVTLIPIPSAVDLTNADILLQQNEAISDGTSKMRYLKGQVDEYWERHSAQSFLFYCAIAIAVLLFLPCFCFCVLSGSASATRRLSCDRTACFRSSATSRRA